MKPREYNLDEYQISSLLSPFRSKPDIVKFWMQAYKMIISHSPPEAGQVRGCMFLYVDKMQRIFVKYGDSTLSASFPISIKEFDGNPQGRLRSGIELTSKDSSEVLAVINNTEAFRNGELLGFADDVMQNSDDPDRLWMILSELIMAEDGYLRVDHDPQRENGDLHPLHHIDVSYSQSATFKIGLSEEMDIDRFSDLLNRKTNCHFLRT